MTDARDKRPGGLLSYVRPGFRLPVGWRDISEVDGDPYLAKEVPSEQAKTQP